MVTALGLSRLLLESSEIVIELDRPKRAARRNGAKSDPLDAIRAAREAMARPQLGTPRTGGERQALSVLLVARRSAINASTEAQQQVFSLVIAAPESIRTRFRGQKLAAMLNTAASLRVRSSWDVETTSTVVALRTLARRAHAMLKEARELQKAIVAIIRNWRPDLLEEFGVGPTRCSGGPLPTLGSRLDPDVHGLRILSGTTHALHPDRSETQVMAGQPAAIKCNELEALPMRIASDDGPAYATLLGGSRCWRTARLVLVRHAVVARFRPACVVYQGHVAGRWGW